MKELQLNNTMVAQQAGAINKGRPEGRDHLTDKVTMKTKKDCNYSTVYTDSNEQFDIRDHLDQLEVNPKEKNKYICPVCGGHNLSVNNETGAYTCYNGCENRDIREAVAPWSEKQRSPQSSYPKRPIKRVKNKPKPAPLPEGDITLATLPKVPEIPQKVRNGNRIETIYPYSDNQWVLRTELYNQDGTRDKKLVIPYHVNELGEKIRGKGDQKWPAYRQDDAIAYAQGKWLLGVEGESCVELARSLSLASITWQGGSWSEKDLRVTFRDLKLGGVAGLVYLPDNDETGRNKADKLAAAAAKEKFPLVILDPLQLWAGMPDKGDIVDWVAAHKEMMSNQDFIRRLEEEIHAAVNRRQQQEQSEPTEADLLRLEIKRYLETSDIVEREILRGKICSTYRLPAKSFNAIAESLDSATAKPKARLLTPEEFMKLEVGGSNWLVPGIVPATGVTLFAGNPGAGKTTLAYDLTAAVIDGDEFLKEVPARQGKVLMVSSDEPFQFGQDKIINRGIRDGYGVLLDWDVSQWKDLDAAIDEMRPALVIVDSFNGIHNDIAFDENSAVASSTVKKLNQLSTKYSCAIVLIHHLNKSKENKGVNKIRGSSAIAASVSAVCILEGEGTVKRFYQPKIRGSEPLDLRVELEPETGTFKVLEGNFADDATKSLSDRLMVFFNANPDTHYEMTEIQEQFPGINRDSLYKALNRLTNAGKITKRPSRINWKTKTWGINSCSMQSQRTTDIEEIPPPSHIPVNVSNDNDESFTEKEFPSLDTSLDTHWTLIGHDNEGKMIEPLQGESLESLDTNTPPGGGRGSNSETVLQNDVPIAPDPETSNTDVVKDVTKFKSGDRVIVHYPAVQSFHQETGIVDSVKTDGQVGIIFANGTRCPFDPENLSLAPETEP